MDKRQFIEHVIEKARSISVSYVLEKRMNLVRRRGTVLGICPFHNDKSLGSFDVSDRKGIWKCFSCGAGGDTVKFISLYDNINYLEAAFRIALDFNCISQWEYDEYYANRRYRKEQIEKIEKRYVELDKNKFKNDIADNATLDKVFRIFISCCTLSEEHEKHLINERRLTSDEISRGLYFTFPTRSILKNFMKKVRDHFGTEDVLLRIPGFYKEENKKAGKKLFTFAKHKGIGIGIQNAFGEVVGIQIRHDNKGLKSSRYVWFSSSFAQDDDKYQGGTASGAPIDVVYPDEIMNTTVFITEGRFKAMHIAKSTGSIAVSIQGVSSWRGLLKVLEVIPRSKKVSKAFKGKKFRIHCLLIAFDSDMNYKHQVTEQLRKMTDQLELNSYFVYYLNWREDVGKGIDDVLINGGKNEIKRYDKEMWDRLYIKMVETLLENEPFENMSQVPEEVVKKYFDAFVLSKIIPLKPNELGQKHRLSIGK
ncbi:CHC2 zinc finger domain-containing protein (plasmid) [Paenibacillus thiaminolyticus]|uniref:CHC2 zinc finger domain-containing protein n=1 Tax=Paenibacillus thiaminolyticus TaxID=49283 RepID=UPI00232D2294|nr:CHC2 zinc finger domain-containing protein [Paenibacillus thiaminolyticus]WCF11444.1 CHC2 zinc finger domain-containing protein [Paenibacillus thiaminolyticus]